MDGLLKAKVKALTMELAQVEQTRLREAGTMMELEELACEIGDARVSEREQQVESLEKMSFKERRTGSSSAEAPLLAVVMMDGGRYQRRDHFGEEGVPEERTRHKHWRESKVGCLLSMQSDIHSSDPCELIPDCFIHASAVREIAKIAEKQGSEENPISEVSYAQVTKESNQEDRYKPPTLLRVT